MSELSKREQTLVSLGAAVASNCVPCIEYHIPEAASAGLSGNQIKEAVQIADKVRRVPARMVRETALAKIEESPNGTDEAANSDCGCSDAGHGVDSC